MIIDDKVIMNYPPPPYLSVANPNATTEAAQSALSNVNTSGKLNLPSLPPHILIQILYALFPDESTSVSTPVSPALSSYTVRPGSDPRVLNNYEARLFDDTRAEKQRKVLFWLSTSLRLVSRHLYIACMHVLRSIYLPSYQALIRPPYSSDPFPLGVPTSPGGTNHLPAYGSSSCALLTLGNGWPSASPIKSLQRETGVLDRYIALKVRQDVFADDTELHMEPEEAFRDLFDVAQPRARLEDLVRIYGVREGVITVPGVRNEREKVMNLSSAETSSKGSSLISLSLSPTISSPSTSIPQLQPSQPSKSTPRSLFSFMKKPPSPSIPQRSPVRPPIQPLPFSVITASFSPRKVGLIYNRKRTISEVQRGLSAGERRSETLEMLAKALVAGLREYLEDSP